MCAAPRVASRNDWVFHPEKNTFYDQNPLHSLYSYTCFHVHEWGFAESRKNPIGIPIIKVLLYQGKHFAYRESTKFISIQIFKRQFISQNTVKKPQTQQTQS